MTDQVANFKKVTVSIGYDAAATNIVLSAGQGAELPNPSGDNYNLIWWDSLVYPDPADDPNVEIVRVTALSTDTLTVTRNQEGSGASTKNTGGSTYKMILGPTAKTITDLAGGAGVAAIYLPAEAAYLPATNPAALTEEVGATVYAGWSHADFDDTTSESIVWRIPVPDYDGGNITVTAYGRPATTPGGAVTAIFDIFTIGLATSEAFNTAVTVDTTVDITFNLNTTELQTDICFASNTIDPANVASDDILVLELKRNISDTLTGDFETFYILVEYTKS